MVMLLLRDTTEFKVAEAVEVHPLASVAVTVYVPEVNPEIF
jgi:hypothetical protein